LALSHAKGSGQVARCPCATVLIRVSIDQTRHARRLDEPGMLSGVEKALANQKAQGAGSRISGRAQTRPAGGRRRSGEAKGADWGTSSRGEDGRTSGCYTVPRPDIGVRRFDLPPASETGRVPGPKCRPLAKLAKDQPLDLPRLPDYPGHTQRRKEGKEHAQHDAWQPGQQAGDC